MKITFETVRGNTTQLGEGLPTENLLSAQAG